MEPDFSCPMEFDFSHPMEHDASYPMEHDASYPMEPDASYPMEHDSSHPMEPVFSYPVDLLDPDFVKTDAKWAKAAIPYDNLSKLPPKQQSTIDNYYVKTTDKGPECTHSVLDYTDPWPVKKPKKQPPPPVEEDEFLTAGIAVERREALNQELQEFQRAHDPEDESNISKAIAARNRRFSQMTSGKAQAAKKEAMPAPVNTHHTRSRAKNPTAGNSESPASNLAATQNAPAVEINTAIETMDNPEDSAHGFGAANEQSLRAMPPVMPPIMPQILMRNTRALSANHSRLHGPVRGVIPGSYYAANPQRSTDESTPAGDELQEEIHMKANPTGGQTTGSQPTGSQTIGDQPTDIAPKKSGRKKAAPIVKLCKKTGEPKQRRAAKACDRCRKHKTRCNGGEPCEACIRRKFTCIYAPNGTKALGKRPREEDHQSDEDGEHKAPIAKRARQEKASAANEKQPNKMDQSVDVKKTPAVKKKHLNEADQPTKVQVLAAKKKQPTKLKEPIEVGQAVMSAQGKASGAKRGREETELGEIRPAKRQRLDSDEDKEAHEKTEKVEEAPLAQPTQPAKPQCSKQQENKRAREDSEDSQAVEAPPAKQQRKCLDDPWLILHNTDVQEDAFLTEKKQINSKEEVSNWIDKQEDAFHNRPSIKLVMPDLLKAILVDDWEHVTKDQQLVPLPHEHSVDQVLKDYLEDERSKREEGSTQMDILEETIAGLREYFERALGRILLYRFERLQYSEKRAEWEANANAEKPEGPSTTYGPEHLCRLLVSLPELIGQTNMDQQSVSRLREEMTKFSNWLSKNSDKYFVRQYEDPGAEYIEKARNA